MSVIPLEDTANTGKHKRTSAADQLANDQYGGGGKPYAEDRYIADSDVHRGAHGRFTSTARPGVAERDARVKNKLENQQQTKKGGGQNNKSAKQQQQQQAATNKNNKQAPPAAPAEDKDIPIVITELDAPLSWAFDAKNQKLDPQNLGEFLHRHGIEGDVSIISATARHSDSTVHAPMALTIVGLQEKGKPLVRGRDKSGNVYTTLIPRNSKFYDGGGDKLYERKNGDFDPADFADHMDVDVTKLRNAFTTYWGRDGEMAKTHIEVHRGNNEQLYKLLTESTGVDSAFAGDSKVNPSIIVSRADHKRVVEKYLEEGGYKRANRVKPNEISVHLHHVGEAHDSPHNEDGWSPATTLPGLTQAEKKELSAPTASHRVTYELRLQVAHKPKSASSLSDDDDDEQ